MSKKGYSLIEIMVVVAIIVMVFGLSLPNFSRFIYGRRLEAGAKEILGTLRLARSYASGNQKLYSVNFDLEKEEYWISKKDTGFEEELVDKVFRAPHGINIIQTTFFDNKVTFRARGMPSRSGSVWITTKQGDIRKITVSGLTGVVKIEKAIFTK